MRKWETTEARKKVFHVHLWFFFFEPWGIHYLFKKHNRQKFQKQKSPLYLHVNEREKWGAGRGEVAKTNWTNAWKQCESLRFKCTERPESYVALGNIIVRTNYSRQTESHARQWLVTNQRKKDALLSLIGIIINTINIYIVIIRHYIMYYLKDIPKWQM